MRKLMYSWKRLLVSDLLILLLWALNNEPITSSTEPSLPKGYLPQKEVDALNDISSSSRTKNGLGYTITSCVTSNKIRCECVNDTICHVKKIIFSDRHLKGEIAPGITNLTFLRYLDLSNNRLRGPIPNALRNLSRLSFIDLSVNNLQESIPDFLGTMKSLKFIDLSRNFLNGTIPPALGALPSLLYLSLWENLLSGPVPEELGNISTLQRLDLSENQLSGLLPRRLENLRNLQELYLNTNEFTGGFPSSFAEFNNLESLDIMGNNFIGRIPKFIENWKQLEFLSLMGNSFEGPIPNSISALTSLSTLHVADLIGSSPFPDIERMTSLQHLTLRNCSITGPIPGYIGRMKSLSYLDLSFNSLTGDLPMFVYHLNFRSIYLKGNMLNGSLPGWLSSTKSNVDLSENKFTNVSFIRPSKKSQNVNLFACCSSPIENQTYTRQKADFQCDDKKPKNDHLYINCGGERTRIINGSIYEADLQHDGASTFYLSPNESWAYTSMGDFLAVDRPTRRYIVNETSGLYLGDATLYRTARISPTSLKYYGLCMKNRNYTVRLHFAEIVFKEKKDFSSMGERVFDVKIQNKMVLQNFNIKNASGGGNLPISKDFEVVVENHLLEIDFYWAGKGSVYVPPGLYGPLISAISVFPVTKSSGRKLSGISIAGIAGSALLLLVLVLVLVLVFIWKMGWLGGKELHNEELKNLELYPGGLFDFRQIKAATQKFSSANKIGEGGFGPVYKGVLPNGAAIAVKQLSSKSKQGIREFVNEIGIISAVHHPNLVKLLGCCTEDNQLLLVYEYMENNSLANALFGPKEFRSRLNWSTRVKICLGIAKGLAFLHEESKLKIIHRDVKPTNVLLDKDLNAKLSDFGCAKLYEGEMTHVITRIAGTSGYMAPEYAMRGHLTYKADVYSFGVVVLEIVSGKNSVNYRPNEETVYLLDLAFVLEEKGDLLELVDPTLGYDYSAKEALTILELAMLCTNQSPTLRPTMSEVVKILEGKTQMKAPLIHAPNLTNDFAKATAMVDQPCTSNAFSSLVLSKEGEECNISVDYSPEISDETGSSLKKVS